MKRANNKSNLDIVRGYLNSERPFIQVGYAGDKDKYIIRKEGEKWTDSSGKTWVQTKYGKQSHTPIMDMIRKETQQHCSVCKRDIRWGDRLDRKMFGKTHKCYECLVEEETMLRIKGKFKLYEAKKLIENEIGYLNDVKDKLKSSREYLKTNKVITFVNSNGLVEEWKHEARKELMAEMQKDWVTCLKKLKSAQLELDKVNEEINKALS